MQQSGSSLLRLIPRFAALNSFASSSSLSASATALGRNMSSATYDVGHSTNIKFHEGAVPTSQKEGIMQQKGCVVWFTGLSGSGKSTVACCLEHALAERNKVTALLDGDNIRHGLNSNLGFTAADREENIRRIGEVSKLFADTGIVTLVSFISPYKKDRDRVRARLQPGQFIEVHMKIPIEVCEERDPKGLYKKAKAGQIANFTGITSPYESPEDPEVHLHTIGHEPVELAIQIEKYLDEH